VSFTGLGQLETSDRGGHNPGFTELANRFYPYPIANIPTAGIVELGSRIASWRRN
jgi:hypothetical protein